MATNVKCLPEKASITAILNILQSNSHQGANQHVLLSYCFKGFHNNKNKILRGFTMSTFGVVGLVQVFLWWGRHPVHRPIRPFDQCVSKALFCAPSCWYFSRAGSVQ